MKIENIEFIHTQLDYSLEKVNLKAIKSIRNNTGKPVGFGLHSPEHFILFAAISFEPSILFFYVKKIFRQKKHVFSMKNMKNPSKSIPNPLRSLFGK